MNFFKRKLLYPSKNTETANFDGVHRAYRSHLKSIKGKLPESAWKLASLTFHDAYVQSVSQPTKKQLIITLDGGYLGCGYDFMNDRPLDGRYTDLAFYGVKKAWVPTTITRDVWLYEEVNLSDVAAFDYQAMLVNDEIRIQADDVQIHTYNLPVKK